MLVRYLKTLTAKACKMIQGDNFSGAASPFLSTCTFSTLEGRCLRYPVLTHSVKAASLCWCCYRAFIVLTTLISIKLGPVWTHCDYCFVLFDILNWKLYKDYLFNGFTQLHRCFVLFFYICFFFLHIFFYTVNFFNACNTFQTSWDRRSKRLGELWIAKKTGLSDDRWSYHDWVWTGILAQSFISLSNTRLYKWITLVAW